MNVKVWRGDDAPEEFKVTSDERGRPRLFLDGEEVPPPCGFSITAQYTQDPLVTLDYGEGESVSVHVQKATLEAYKGMSRIKEERGEAQWQREKPAAEDRERLKQAAAKLRETLRGAEESARAFAETVMRDCNS